MSLRTLVVESNILPAVDQFMLLSQAAVIYIDLESRFIKQTNRNRFYISTANGSLPLIVPVSAGKTMLSLQEVKISYGQPWQRTHLRTIKSAYGSAPFYPYLIDEFESVYTKKYERLYELNLAMLNWLFRIYKIRAKVLLIERGDTSIINSEEEDNALKAGTFIDLRSKMKQATPYIETKSYHQVFIEKHGFTPGLSILDYLFNMGNDLPVDSDAL